MGVEVRVTRELSPEMQKVADCREHVRRCEARVDGCKEELKEAKAAWEQAVAAQNQATDEMIAAERERQPTLLDYLDDEKKGQEQAAVAAEAGPREVEAEPAADAGDRPAAQVDHAPPAVLSGPDEPRGLPALPPARPTTGPTPRPRGPRGGVPDWRLLWPSEHLDGPPHLFDALHEHGVADLGTLADKLLAGETFGLTLCEVEELKEGIEDVSADDDRPVKFTSEDDREEKEKGDEEQGEGENCGPTPAGGSPIDTLIDTACGVGTDGPRTAGGKKAKKKARR